MSSNPLTEEELEHFRYVMNCLSSSNKLHMRADTAHTLEDWEASII